MKFLLKMRSLRTKCLILVSHGCISVILQAQGSAWRSRTLPVTWESKGTSSTLAFWPWSKKALKHMLNFKHECSHPHKRTTYSPKIKHLQKYFTVSASLLSILQDYTLSSDSQKKKTTPKNPTKNPSLNRSWLLAGLLIAKSCLSTCGTPLWRPMSSPALATAAQQWGASPEGSACLELLFQPLPCGSKKVM